MFIAANQKID